MAKVSGIFEYFKDLDKISVEDVALNLKSSADDFYLENYIANKALYPQTVPVTAADMELEMAILAVAVKQNLTIFKLQQKKLQIPKIFITRFPNLQKLIIVVKDAMDLKEEIITLEVLDEGRVKPEGSLIKVNLKDESGSVRFKLDNKSYQTKKGSILFIPCNSKKCHLQFKTSSGAILNKKEGIMDVYGGIIGVVVDAR